MLSKSDYSRCDTSIDVITRHASRPWNARRLVARAPGKHVTDVALSRVRITEQAVLGYWSQICYCQDLQKKSAIEVKAIFQGFRVSVHTSSKILSAIKTSW